MLDDKDLIERYFQRDETAIAATSEKYGRLCFGISQNILHSREDAEECVNDTYLKVWGAIPPERPTDFKGFISAIVRRVSLDRYRFLSRKKRSAGLEVPLSELESILPDLSVPPDAERGELTGILNDFLESLPTESRVIFIRRYWYFDSISDIATRYRFSEGKVKMNLSRTRSKLRNYLIERGVSL